MSIVYFEVDSGKRGEVSRTLTGDHESRVTDTGGVVVVKDFGSIESDIRGNR